MRTLYLASSNAHKIVELKEQLASPTLEIEGAPAGFGVDEDAPDLAGNAAKKARALLELHLARGHSDTWVLADDSGLEVDALQGRPGVRSARFGEDEAVRLGHDKPADQDEGCRSALLAALTAVDAPVRTARLRCTLALCRGLGAPIEFFDGVVEGHIAFRARGSFGFGYDPLFIPEGYDKTFGELGPSVKRSLSHRSRALCQLKASWDKTV